MSEKTDKLRTAVARDEKKLEQLQTALRANKEKLKEAEQTELLNRLHTLSTGGIGVEGVISAIETRDMDTLLSLMEKPAKPDVSGNGGAHCECI